MLNPIFFFHMLVVLLLDLVSCTWSLLSSSTNIASAFSLFRKLRSLLLCRNELKVHNRGGSTLDIRTNYSNKLLLIVISFREYIVLWHEYMWVFMHSRQNVFRAPLTCTTVCFLHFSALPVLLDSDEVC